MDELDCDLLVVKPSKFFKSQRGRRGPAFISTVPPPWAGRRHSAGTAHRHRHYGRDPSLAATALDPGSGETW